MPESADLTATRAGYDAIAPAYAEHFRDELDRAPLDRALLAAFVELVRRDHDEPTVLDVGRGPGTVTALLQRLGAAVVGIDLSPTMVDVARRAHPGLDVRVGEMSALDEPDASAAGLVAWYSLVHVPAARRPQAVAEFRRVLRPGGHLLLAFQVGTDTLHLDEAFGRGVDLDFHRLTTTDVAGLLEASGFAVAATLQRTPEPTSRAAPVPQAFLLARAVPTTITGAR